MMKTTCEFEQYTFPPLTEITEKSEGTCPVGWAQKIADDAAAHSCGHCVMCREGSLQISLVLKDVTTGKGQSDDLELVSDICKAMEETASCQQARDAALRIRTSLELHREEWESHLRRKRCAALTCRAYTTVAIKPDVCNGCGDCIPVCEVNAIAGADGMIHVIDQETCTRCNACIAACTHDAISIYGAVLPKLPSEPVPVGSFVANAGRRRRRG